MGAKNEVVWMSLQHFHLAWNSDRDREHPGFCGFGEVDGIVRQMDRAQMEGKTGGVVEGPSVAATMAKAFDLEMEEEKGQ